MRQVRAVRSIRRVRTSTWILIAVFMTALAAYVYLRP